MRFGIRENQHKTKKIGCGSRRQSVAPEFESYSSAKWAMMNTPESQVAAAHDAWVRAGQRLVATDKSLSAERRLLELQAKLCKNMESERTHLEFLVRIKLAHK